MQSGDNNADDSDGLIVDVDGGEGAVDDAHHNPIMRSTGTAAAGASTGATAAAPPAVSTAAPAAGGTGAADDPDPRICSTLTRDTATTAAREAGAGAAGVAVAAVGPAEPEKVSGRSRMAISTGLCNLNYAF